MYEVHWHFNQIFRRYQILTSFLAKQKCTIPTNDGIVLSMLTLNLRYHQYNFRRRVGVWASSLCQSGHKTSHILTHYISSQDNNLYRCKETTLLIQIYNILIQIVFHILFLQSKIIFVYRREFSILKTFEN